MGVDGMSDTSEQKIDELLNLMRSFALDPDGMNDAGRIGFVYKYDYNPDATYEKLDVVLFGPSLWTPKQNTTGNAPPDQSQPGQESVKENEFWQIYLPGALGADYVKKTDLSKPPTETEAGKPGINFPDGKTIQIDENGMLTGTPLDFNGTWDELFAGIESGEVKNGMIGYIKGTKSDPDNPNHPNSMLFDIDDYLSLVSSNAVQNRIITAALNQVKQLAEQNAQLIEDVKGLRASVNAFGLAKVCPVNVTDVTEDNGTVIGGWEKNPSKDGTLANKIYVQENNIKSKMPYGAMGIIEGQITFDQTGRYNYVFSHELLSPYYGLIKITGSDITIENSTKASCTLVNASLAGQQTYVNYLAVCSQF